MIEATTVGAACTFKPALPKRKKEGEEEDDDEEDEEGDADRRAVEEFMGRYTEVRLFGWWLFVVVAVVGGYCWWLHVVIDHSHLSDHVIPHPPF